MFVNIEDVILRRAASLRSNWLIFKSFKKLHEEAQLRKKFQIFEVVLGSDIGEDLTKYALN